MIVTCNEDQYGGMKESFCGMTFDDAECSVICPHDPLPPKLSEEELQALYKETFGDKSVEEVLSDLAKSEK